MNLFRGERLVLVPCYCMLTGVCVRNNEDCCLLFLSLVQQDLENIVPAAAHQEAPRGG